MAEKILWCIAIHPLRCQQKLFCLRPHINWMDCLRKLLATQCCRGQCTAGVSWCDTVPAPGTSAGESIHWESQAGGALCAAGVHGESTLDPERKTHSSCSVSIVLCRQILPLCHGQGKEYLKDLSIFLPSRQQRANLEVIGNNLIISKELRKLVPSGAHWEPGRHEGCNLRRWCFVALFISLCYFHNIPWLLFSFFCKIARTSIRSHIFNTCYYKKLHSVQMHSSQGRRQHTCIMLLLWVRHCYWLSSCFILFNPYRM